MVALVTFSWSSPPSPLPPGSSPVASYNLQVTNCFGNSVFSKTGLPATATSYTTIPSDTMALIAAGNPYKLLVTAIDANNVASLTPAVVQFEAVPPVFSPPVPSGLTVGPVTFQ